MKHLIIALCVTLSSLTVYANNLVCEDGMTFGYGSIHFSPGETTKVLLRGYASHGRTPNDMGKELGANLTEDPFLVWVSVEFEGKNTCQLNTKRKLVHCYTNKAEAVFLKGWELGELEEIDRVALERAELSIDNLEIDSLSPGFPATEVRQFKEATLFATNSKAYMSTTKVRMLRKYCRPKS